MNRVQGKVAVVTGGSLGIGRATCILLAKEGAQVAITDLRDEEGKALENLIQAEGGTARYFHLDVSKEKEVAAVFAEIARAFGKIDVLVNNAGIVGANKPTHEISEEEWDQVMNVNVKGVFFGTKNAIPYLKQVGGGSIISAPDVPPLPRFQGRGSAHDENRRASLRPGQDSSEFDPSRIHLDADGDRRRLHHSLTDRKAH